MATNPKTPQNSRTIKTPKKPLEIKPVTKKRKKKFRQKRSNPILIGILVISLIVFTVSADIFYPDTFIGNMISSTIGKFFNLVNFVESYHLIVLESLAILIFIWVLTKVLSVVLKLLFHGSQRSRTVGALFVGILKYLLVVIAIFMILGAWGVQATTLLAGAGILGLAISFGAQSLIEDILSGLFIISEKQFSIGDVIEIDGFRGTVVEMSIRTTKFENIMGDTKIMNNSDIRGAINTSSNLSPAICEISISYDQDIEKVEKVINDHLEMIGDAIPAIIDGPYYRGVQSLSDSAVVLRVVGNTQEHKKLQTVRDLNREMKLLFDKHKIKIPFPQLTVHVADTSVTKPKTSTKSTAKPKK